jgi:hypothetical protein
MLRRIMLSVFATAVTAVTAGAADLPTHSRLGAIFAEPSEVRARAVPSSETSAPDFGGFNQLPSSPWTGGGYYYGSQYSYYDGGPYYGGAYVAAKARLPYVCGLYGYC